MRYRFSIKKIIKKRKDPNGRRKIAAKIILFASNRNEFPKNVCIFERKLSFVHGSRIIFDHSNQWPKEHCQHQYYELVYGQEKIGFVTSRLKCMFFGIIPFQNSWKQPPDFSQELSITLQTCRWYKSSKLLFLAEKNKYCHGFDSIKWCKLLVRRSHLSLDKYRYNSRCWDGWSCWESFHELSTPRFSKKFPIWEGRSAAVSLKFRA